MPEFPQISHNTQKQRPDRNVLYVGNTSNGISESSPDCTESLQKLLDQAASEGGGIVFLPPGKYKFKGNIDIPTGVELKGALDNSTTPVGPGSIIEVYAGKDNPNATPFMTMQPYSGLRGVTFDYPEQKSSLLPANLHEYPYCVQVQGKDVYIVNVAIRAACYGFDLFTYKCDNHYIDYISGHSFKVGVKVGGGSENGKICNLQYNPICYSNGYETKFGSFSNSIKEYASAAGDYVFDNFYFLILGDCKNELLYNDFGVCVQRGLIFSKENEEGASGLSLGLGIDGSRRAIYFDHLDPQGFDLINSQIVASENKDKTADSRYIETTGNFKGESTFFNSDYWGGAMQCLVARGGTLNFYTAWFSQNMPKYFGDLGGNSTINIVNSNITSMSTLLASGGESHLSMQSTVSDFNGIETGKCILWKNNLGNTPVLADIKPLDRTGWIASGSKNNGDAKYAIDGKDDTRWSSGSQKIPGDWFKIDMRTPQKFSTIILDSSKSPNDSPAKYELYVSDDDMNWGDPVTTGVGGGMQTIINFPTQNARYFKIVQTGDTKTNYWSIHELKVLRDDTEAGIENTGLNVGKIYFSKGILYLDGFDGSNNIYICNINGQQIYSCRSEEKQLQIPLMKGIYSISVENKGKYSRSKLVVQ